MQGLFRRVAASIAALVLLAPQAGSTGIASAARHTGTTIAQARPPGHVVQSPPVRIDVKEPPRVRPSRPPFSAVRPKAVPAVRPLNGRHVPGPPMLRPSEIDAALKAAARRRLSAPPIAPPSVSVRRIGAPGLPGARPGTRNAQSLPSDPNASGTGINPWWRYQEESVPGGGRVMVNVGTGNLLLQDDDMSVPHKGIAMAFRRTYNSQSLHNVSGSDAGPAALYGNGWTNTWDAHVVLRSPNNVSVYDIDGARYDYDYVGGATPNVPLHSDTPGNHAQLVWDGGCGVLWTKKTGTSYYFYAPWPPLSCAQMSPVGGYAGRLYQIIGRNRNTYLTFAYAWDNGDASVNGKINTISVQAESGLTATLSFADVNGRRLLQQLTFPDGATTVSYGYDANGNLNYVSRPPNNAAGTRPLVVYLYQALGNDFVMWAAASPRLVASCAWSGCFGDGGVLWFGYSGTTAATSTVASIQQDGVVNPTIPDGTNSGPIQGSSYSNLTYVYNIEYYTTGVTTPTFRDTDGHMTNWVVDGSGRPTQTQECTASINQGQQCTGTWLVANEAWDANNNLTSEMDPRGYQTDYGYDPNGNTVVAAAPPTTVVTPSGTAIFRPTQLFDYDQYNNLIAYCDQRASHPQGDWTTSGPPTAGGPDALCANNGSSAHAVFTFPINPAPPYEPFGELTNIRSPLGYNRAIAYAPGQQGGTDYGLPTSVRGDPIAQSDGTRTPFVALAYDASGNLVCSSADGNDPTTTTVLIYDSLNRVVAAGDPDDATVTNGYCAKTPGIAGSAIATRTAYFPNGQVATTQTPPEAAANVSSQFQYDLDGNVTSEQRHYTANAGPTQKWYDGVDRLVEVMQPTDANYDFYAFAWTTRYLYDLTAGGTVAIASSAPYHAYGNLFKTQELLPNGVATPQWNEAGSAAGPSTGTSSPTWQDTAGTAFDALDRGVTAFRNTGAALMPVTQTYDGAGNAGLLSQKCNANNECLSFAYDPRGAKSQVTFNVASSSTQSFSFDEVGRIAGSSNAIGGFSDVYDADGRKTRRQETVGSTSATIAYAYYEDGLRKSLDASAGAQSLPNALAYTYRPDGVLRQLGVASTQTFSFSYTGGRRLTARSDTTGQQAETFTYTANTSPTSYGLAQSMSGPGFYETGMTYNAEGGQVGGAHYAFNGQGYFPAAGGTATYTTRGEVVWDASSGVGLPALYANGMRIQTARSTVSPKTANVRFNAFQSLPVQTNSGNTCGTGCQSLQNDSNLNYGYDNGGRQLTTDYTSNADGATPYTNSKSYDAEDHLLVQVMPWLPTGNVHVFMEQSLGYRWGPFGHPLQIGSTTAAAAGSPMPTDFQYDALVWDDDDLLFTVNSAGQINDLKVADFADYVPGASNPLTVWDRGVNGQVYGCHTGGAAAAVTSSSFQNVQMYCTASSSFQGPVIGSNSRGAVGRGGMLLIHKSDGFSDGRNTFQGVRTFDPQAGVWTTPDAYHGDVHDPMSQKPFMWNRNNPYAYSDPSGYFPVFERVLGIDEATQDKNNDVHVHLTERATRVPGGVAIHVHNPYDAANGRAGRQRGEAIGGVVGGKLGGAIGTAAGAGVTGGNPVGGFIGGQIGSPVGESLGKKLFGPAGDILCGVMCAPSAKGPNDVVKAGIELGGKMDTTYDFGTTLMKVLKK